MEVNRGGEGSIGDVMPVSRSLAAADACPGRTRPKTPTGSAGIVKAEVRHISSHRFALSQPGIIGAGRQPLSCIIEAEATGAPIVIAASFAATAEVLIVNAISPRLKGQIKLDFPHQASIAVVVDHPSPPARTSSGLRSVQALRSPQDS